MLDPESKVPTIEDNYAGDISRIASDRHIRRSIRVLDIQGVIIKSSEGKVVTADEENRRWVNQMYETKGQPVPPWDVVTVGLMLAKDIVLKEMKSRGQA